jgi:hypothetical protein
MLRSKLWQKFVRNSIRSGMSVFLQLLFVLSFPFQVAKREAPPVASLHPFYVSVTEVSQNAAEKTLEVSCRFFADDFEETLQKAYKTPLNITTEKDKVQFDKFIPDYVNKHLQLLADGKSVKLTYVGYEKEKESVFCYFEVLNVPSVKELRTSNSLLHDFKNEQINIMHVAINGKRQSAKLNFPQKDAAFQF